MQLRRFETQEEFTHLHNSFFAYFVDLNENPYRAKPIFEAFKETHPDIEATLTDRVTRIYNRSERIRDRYGGVEGLLRSVEYLETRRNHPECQQLGWKAYDRMRTIAEAQPDLLANPEDMDALLR